jgi:hypothetical protein
VWCCESADFLGLTKASNYFRSFFLIGGFGCTRWIIALEGLNSGRRSLGKKHICAQTGESYSVSAEGFFFVPMMEISLFLRYHSVSGILSSSFAWIGYFWFRTVVSGGWCHGIFLFLMIHFFLSRFRFELRILKLLWRLRFGAR